MEIEVQNPLDQFYGKNRLINWLETNFSDVSSFNTFFGVSAFSKSGPFLKLLAPLQYWQQSEEFQSTFIFGIDHKGTSIESLQTSLELFNNSYIVYSGNSTFHPKIYFFEGKNEVEVYFGSSNMTVGGLETNFESGVFISLSKQVDSDIEQIEEIKKIFNDLLDNTRSPVKSIDTHLIDILVNHNLVVSEKRMGYIARTNLSNPVENDLESSDTSEIRNLFGIYSPKRARDLEKSIKNGLDSANYTKSPIDFENSDAYSEEIKKNYTEREIVEKLLIEVIPHHNGELFLSVGAIKKNPDFFGLPFTGTSTPTKANKYPSREPKPNVSLNLYDEENTLTLHISKHQLTMVYYERKSDFRITVPSDFRDLIYDVNNPDEPKLLEIIKNVNSENEYTLKFYLKGNPYYENYLNNLEKISIPTGGKKGIQRTYRWEIK